MQDIQSVFCKGSLIAEVKGCSTINSPSPSIISSINRVSSPNDKIKLKCVTKNSDLKNKTSPRKLFNNDKNVVREQVNYDYFLIFYLDKHDHPELRQYLKEVKKSPIIYRQNFIVVESIREFKNKFEELKLTLCHKKFSLIVSQFGMLNYRQLFSQIEEIHFFISHQQKYSNLSFLMKEKNLKSFLYDLHKVDQLLQDLNVLKKDAKQQELPFYSLSEKIKQFEIEKKSMFGPTGFNFSSKIQSNKQNSHRNPSSNCSSSYDRELRMLRLNELNLLRVPQNSNNGSNLTSANQPLQYLPNQYRNKKQKSVENAKEQKMKSNKKSNYLWFKNYSKAVSQLNRDKNLMKSIYQDEINENSLLNQSDFINSRKQEDRYSKTEDVFYRKKNNNNF